MSQKSILVFKLEHSAEEKPSKNTTDSAPNQLSKIADPSEVWNLAPEIQFKPAQAQSQLWDELKDNRHPVKATRRRKDNQFTVNEQDEKKEIHGDAGAINSNQDNSSKLADWLAKDYGVQDEKNRAKRTEGERKITKKWLFVTNEQWELREKVKPPFFEELFDEQDAAQNRVKDTAKVGELGSFEEHGGRQDSGTAKKTEQAKNSAKNYLENGLLKANNKQAKFTKDVSKRHDPISSVRGEKDILRKKALN